MTLNELQVQALKLPPEERWQLISALIRSVQPEPSTAGKPKGLAASLVGLAKTGSPPPTDEEVAIMLDERLTQKYL